VPGKKRHMLILDLEDAKNIYLGGNKEDNFVFSDIHYCGNFPYTVKKKLTEAIFNLYEKTLGTKPECASLTITEHTNWGGFGDFHDDYYSDAD
jgi:hypothetical protein